MPDTAERCVPSYQDLVELGARLDALDHAYHTLDKPLMNDGDYDALVRQYWSDIETYNAANEVAFVSPRAGRVGAPVENGTAHSAPMLSLDNTYTPQEAYDWIAQRGKGHTWVAEPKIDGLSLSLVYLEGRLIAARTRGDGETGEDVTANVSLLRDVPSVLTGGFPEKLEIRGEAYMGKADFLALNERLVAAGEKPMANPRSAAAGTIRAGITGKAGKKKVQGRSLSFFPWGFEPAGSSDDASFATQTEFLAAVEAMGFSVPSNSVRLLPGQLSGLTVLENFYDIQMEHRAGLEYDVDGIVLKVDSFEEAREMGATARAPRWAVALKYPAETALTTLEAVTWQVGRTGALTPVAELAPVGIGGVIVSRATLHNMDEIRRKGFSLHDTVEVARSGDVIPKVLRVFRHNDGHGQIEAPSHCPVCHAEVVELTCTGSACRGSAVERLSYAVSRSVLDVEGLSRKTVEQLNALDLLWTVGDVFRLSTYWAILQEMPRMSLKTVEKLLRAIDKAKTTTLHRAIMALCIPDVGEETAKMLASVFETPNRFLDGLEALAGGDSELIASMLAIEGMGETRLNKIQIWSRDLTMAEDLFSQLNIEAAPQRPEAVDGPLSGEVVVFTGTFDVNRKLMQQQAQSLGAETEDRITSRTTLLVAGEKAGSKVAAAQKKNIRVIGAEGWDALTAQPG